MGSPISQVQMPQTNQPSGKGMQRSDGLDQNAINANPQGFQQWQQDRNAFQQSQQSDGISRPMGKGGRITYPGQSGQPQYGQPNRYSNTVGPWDNASIGTQNPFQRSGKGKGA